MLSHKRQAVQLKDDLMHCAVGLKESADSFNCALARIEQVLNILISTIDGPQIEAKFLNESRGLLTAKEVAAYLGVSDRSIYLWIKQKNFPYRKVGEDLRFDLKEVEAWTTPETKTLEKAPLHVVK
jgi:excisionase family DNA binding protein